MHAGLMLVYTGAAPSMVAAPAYSFTTPLMGANANTGLTDPTPLTTVSALTGFGSLLYAHVS